MSAEQFWSPIQVHDLTWADGRLQMRLENRYDFTDLVRCTFQWRMRRMPAAWSTNVVTTLAQGKLPSPELAPGEMMDWSVPLAVTDLANDDVLELSATDAAGRVLWTRPVGRGPGSGP